MKDDAKKRTETAKEIEKDGVREVRNRQAEEALRASEERFRLLAQTANDAIITVDADGNITFWNKAAETIFGYSHDEAVGKPITFIIPRRFHKAHENGMRQLLSTGKSKILGEMYQVTGLRKDGSEFPVELSTTTWRSREELFFTAIVRDITDRLSAEQAGKRAERELRKRKQEFVALVENAPDVISRFDNKFRHVYINPAVERESGKPPEFFMGKTNQELGTPEELILEWHKALESVFETGQETTIETEYPTPTGTKYYSNRLAPEFSEDGSVGTVLNISRDITERKRAEEELRKHQEHLEEMTEERTTELGAANQELRQEMINRERAEEALRESEQRYRGLVELSPDAIAVHAEGKIVFVNRQAVRLLGAPNPEELIGKSILDIVHPDYRDLVMRRVQQMTGEGKKVPLVEEKLIRLDGRVVDVEVAAVPITYENKSAVQVVVRDITERKRTEDALYEQEERFRKIFEEGQLGMAIVGPDEQFLKVNARMCRMFGYMEQELTTLTWKDITHPDDIRVGVKHVEKLLRGEIPYYKAEKRYIKKNGEILWARLTVSVVRRDDGSVMYRLAMIDDITERKQAEEELKRSEENFRNLFRLSSDAIIIQDEDRNIVDVNMGAERLFGYTKEELINDPGIKLADYEQTDRAAADEYIKKAFGGETQHFEWWGRKKDGTTFPEEVTLNKTIYDGREVIFVTTRDITERKKAEVRLLDYQKQLQSLASELSLAEERERKRIATELHDRIAQSLAFSKIKLGSLREKVSSPNIVQIVEELHEVFEQLIQDTRSLTFELASPILYELGLEKAIEWLADHVQKESGLCIDFKSDEQDKFLSEDVRITLFQAVREAMINVIKHAQAQNMRVSVEKVAHVIRIEVVDDGIGFDVAEMLSPGERGRGFGLFSVRERIKFLGGELEVHSSPGLGTRITLNAPLGGEKS